MFTQTHIHILIRHSHTFAQKENLRNPLLCIVHTYRAHLVLNSKKSNIIVTARRAEERRKKKNT